MLKEARQGTRSNLCIDFVEIASSRQCLNQFSIALEIIAIFLAGERGAGFVDALEFAVAHDLGIGIVHLQPMSSSASSIRLHLHLHLDADKPKVHLVKMTTLC